MSSTPVEPAAAPRNAGPVPVALIATGVLAVIAGYACGLGGVVLGDRMASGARLSDTDIAPGTVVSISNLVAFVLNLIAFVAGVAGVWVERKARRFIILVPILVGVASAVGAAGALLLFLLASLLGSCGTIPTTGGP